MNFLVSKEREAYERFLFPHLKRQYLVTRALVRSVLAYYSNIHPKEFSFRKNAWGRPEIENTGSPPGLTFNLSHTDGMVVCLIGFGREIGVDVEFIDRPIMVPELAKSSFSQLEYEAISKLSGAEQRNLFFEIWTLKEAYVKARGMGLSLPLDQFSFEIDQKKTVKVFLENTMKDQQDTWQFNLLKLTSEHQIALAIRRYREADLGLVEIQTIPFRWENVAP
jgi:4'-phosphopantetheinyl transferase